MYYISKPKIILYVSQLNKLFYVVYIYVVYKNDICI